MAVHVAGAEDEAGVTGDAIDHQGGAYCRTIQAGLAQPRLEVGEAHEVRKRHREHDDGHEQCGLVAQRAEGLAGGEDRSTGVALRGDEDLGGQTEQ